jgi:hypothetical protein
MSDGKVHELRIRTDDGKLTAVRARIKDRCDQDGVDGVLLDVLHPKPDKPEPNRRFRTGSALGGTGIF